MAQKQLQKLVSKRFIDFKPFAKNDKELKIMVANSFVNEYAFNAKGIKLLDAISDEMNVNIVFTVTVEDKENNVSNNVA